MAMAGGTLSARGDIGFGASQNRAAVSTTTPASQAVGSTSVLRKTLGRIAQELGQAQLKWAEQVAESTSTKRCHVISDPLELATCHARNLCVREERLAHLRGLEVASGCIRRGAAHGTNINRSNGHTDKEAARLAEENMLLRRRADMMFARMSEPAKAEDSLSLIEEELIAVRESAAGEAARLRKVAEANGESELERARAHAITIELESEKKSMSLSERLAASLKATLLEGAERFSEAAYLRGEQEDVNRQTEQMERKLTLLRRRSSESTKALKIGEEQLAGLEAKSSSLRTCRNADEAARRKKIASLAKHREAAEMWIEHYAAHEQASVLANEARECENLRRTFEHQEQILCEEFATLRAQTDTAKSGLHDSIRDAIFAAEHTERVASQKEVNAYRSECEHLEMEATYLRSQANKLRDGLQDAEAETVAVDEATFFQELAQEAHTQVAASEEANLQHELNQLCHEIAFENKKLNVEAITIERLRSESDELHSAWMMQEEILAKEQKSKRECLQEELEFRNELQLKQQAQASRKFEEFCRQSEEDTLLKVRRKEMELEESRASALMDAEAEMDSYTLAEEDFRTKAEKVGNEHASKMERQEGQLICVSGSLATASQLLIQTDLEIVDLQEAHNTQFMHNRSIGEKCRVLAEMNEMEQARVQSLREYEQNLLREIETSQERIHDFTEAHSNLSEFMSANACTRTVVDENVAKERIAIEGLRANLVCIVSDVKDRREKVDAQLAQDYLRQEEAIRTETRAMTFEVSELEASVDAALAFRKSRLLKSRNTCKNKSGSSLAAHPVKNLNSPRVAAECGVTTRLRRG